MVVVIVVVVCILFLSHNPNSFSFKMHIICIVGDKKNTADSISFEDVVGDAVVVQVDSGK